MEARSAALDRARHHAVAWLESLDDRSVSASVDTDQMVRRLGGLPDAPTPAPEVVDLLAGVPRRPAAAPSRRCDGEETGVDPRRRWG